MILAASSQNSMFSLIISMVILFGVMYVIVILPQKKKEKKSREMISALKVGEVVVSIGGVAGKIVNIKDDEITIETSVEKTQIVFKKWAIKEVNRPVSS